jgi:hypothetical protein
MKSKLDTDSSEDRSLNKRDRVWLKKSVHAVSYYRLRKRASEPESLMQGERHLNS